MSSTADPAERSIEEVERLRRTMRDLVEFSALPEVWAIHGPDHIATSLAEAVCQSFAVSFAYVRLRRHSGSTIEAVRCRDEDSSSSCLRLIADALAPHLDEPLHSGIVLADPLGKGTLHLSITRFGLGQDSGVLAAASPRPGFPSDEERLLLLVAGNQAAVACQRHQGTEMKAVLASIIESADDAIVSKTLEGVITSWNPGAERLFGYTPAEAIGNSIYMLIPGEMRDEELDILARLRRGERIEHYETVRMCKDGRRVDVSLTVSPMRDDSGRIIGASKIARDIAERKQAEQRQAALRRREQEALRESRVLIELALTLAAELDVDRLAQKVIDAVTELTGAHFGTFIHTSNVGNAEPQLLHAISGEFDGQMETLGLSLGTKLLSVTFADKMALRIEDMLAESRFGQDSLPPGCGPSTRSYLAVPVLSGRGAVLGGLLLCHPSPGAFGRRAERLARGVAAHAAICLDNAQLYRRAQAELAERRLAEDRERSARTEAEHATRMRDAFLATASHELRTPLNSVLGWTQLLRQAPDDPEIRARAVDAIERGARAQARLIEDMLDTSCIVSGKLRLELQTVDLVPIVQAAIETIRPAAEEKAIQVERVLDPLTGPIRGDPARLNQVLWNLLWNAVKFTPRGGRIHVHLRSAGSMAEIRVSDTGQGIAAEFLPHVFERFRQADTSITRTHGGLGLGLAVVRHLVELHGGKVDALSAGEGQGATFIVQLPIPLLRDMPFAEDPSADWSYSSNETQLTGVKILVVDDDPDSCEMLRRVLQERGAHVETVSSSNDALRRLEEMQPDVLVSDIGMPEMDGYELIRTIRARGHPLPAVALTAFARSEDRIRSLRSGFQSHVPKPLEPRELTEVIASLVRSAPRPRSFPVS
jgi:PAS domain S-box-containing protein